MRAAAVLALALGALLAGAAPAAVAAGEREEYTPRSRPLPDGEVCPPRLVQARTNPNAGTGERCARPCRPRHVLLSDFKRARLRCVPSRPSRLWYRAQLDADVSRVQVTSSRTPDGSRDATHKWLQTWRFTSSGAAVVSRRCSALLPSQTPEHSAAIVQLPDDAGRMPCARVGRAIGAELFEDTSFGFRGTIAAGPTTDSDAADITRTIGWAIRGPNGTILPQRVETTCTFTDLREWVGTGPRRRATIGTLGRSGRFGGTSVGLEAVEAPGPGTYRESAISCPPPPGALPGQFSRDAKQGVGELTSVFGLELADLFTPNLARQFGRAQMRATQTVKRRRPSGPDGSLASEATFTLS